MDFTGKRMSAHIEDRRGQPPIQAPLPTNALLAPTTADNVNRVNKTDRLPVSASVPSDTMVTREGYDFKKGLRDEGPYKKLADRHEAAAVDHEMHANNSEETSNQKYKKENAIHRKISNIHGQASSYYYKTAEHIKSGDALGARHMMTLGDHYADQAQHMSNKHGVENYFHSSHESTPNVNESIITAIKDKEFDNAHQLIEAAFADVMARKLVEMKQIIQARGSVTLEQVLRELNDPARAAFQALNEAKEVKKKLNPMSEEQSDLVVSS